MASEQYRLLWVGGYGIDRRDASAGYACFVGYGADGECGRGICLVGVVAHGCGVVQQRHGAQGVAVESRCRVDAADVGGRSCHQHRSGAVGIKGSAVVKRRDYDSLFQQAVEPPVPKLSRNRSM